MNVMIDTFKNFQIYVFLVVVVLFCLFLVFIERFGLKIRYSMGNVTVVGLGYST